ncbi:MAG TPA: hypothetical protein VIY56_10540 [Vicinamibacterales bacterium]
MTPYELEDVLVEYRAGLDAELALLRRLESVPSRQRSAPTTGLAPAAEDLDEREGLMASLVSIEHHLRPLRDVLSAQREVLCTMPMFPAVAALHREAGDLVARIVASDEDALAALREAERARRFEASAVGRGEATLAAYRRVVAPHHEAARIVSRRG